MRLRMIKGRVSRRLRVRLPIELLLNDTSFRSVEVDLDTGFTGDLTLPAEVIRQCGLAPEGERPVVLANGDEVYLRVWQGTTLWHGSPRRVRILQAEGEPLLGMNLLRGSRVTLDALVEFQPAAFEAYADSYFGLMESLERLFGRPVDLVVSSAIKNPYFLQSVEKTRTPVYEA